MIELQNQSSELYARIERLIRTVRRRRTMRIALRGLLVSGMVALGVFFLSSWAMDQLLYTERAVKLIRAFSWFTVAACFVSQLILPFLRRPTDRQIALYIEEHEPDLESALITALEVGSAKGSAQRDPVNERLLYRRLLADTIERCERIDFGKGIEKGALQRASGGLALVGGLALLMALVSPAFIRHGASLLMFPWNSAAAIDNPYGIEISPEGEVFAKGADIPIRARLIGFSDENVRLAVRVEDATEWSREEMIPGANHDGQFGLVNGARAGAGVSYSDYESLLIAMDQSFSYYVEAGGIRSRVVDIEVIDLPYTDRIDLRYRFPAYSGVPEELVEDAGDIAALRGALVELRVTPTIETDAVRLTIEGDEPIALVQDSSGLWTHELTIDRPGFYHLEMRDKRGRYARASGDYSITPLDDRPPLVSIRTPGRDLKTSKIEEVFIEASAEDDYGVRAIDLHYSLNGSEEVVRRLMTAPADAKRKKSSGTHTFFLEDFDLQDGDFISYYASTRDGRPGSGSRTESSDIYFIEIRPFSQDYRKADGGGGGGGGQGGGADSELSERQRQVVAATFALMRDRAKVSRKEFEESLATVSLSQGKLRGQVQTLMTRMGNRDTLMSDEEFTRVLALLESAVPPMEKAIAQLEEKKLSAALLSEQEALAALQRAEAMFREVRVSFDPGGGGGGGGAGEMAEDLADLFELELDKLRNQYEAVQRGQQQQGDQQIDELEERLKELARRQQKENERKQRLGKRSSAAGGDGQQENLIEETEELARQLERLARAQASPEMRQTAKQLERAVDQMKRAGSEGQSQAGSAGSGAAQALEDARRLLDKSRRGDVNEGVEQLQARAEGLGEQQRRMRDQVEQLNQERESSGSEGPLEREQLQALLERKDQIESQVAGLEEELDRLARQARSDQPELARSLQQAANDLRTTGVGKKIEYSKAVLEEGDMELASRFEQMIQNDLGPVLEGVKDAAEQAGKGDSAAGEGSLEKTRDLVEGLESLEQRLRDRLEGAEKRATGGRGSTSQEDGVNDSQRTGAEGASGESGTSREAGSQGVGEGSQEQESGSQEGQGQTGESRSGANRGTEGQRGQGGEQATESGGGRAAPQAGRQGDAEGQGEGQRLGEGSPAMGSGSSGGSFQPGAFNAEEIRQLNRELQQRLSEAENLRRSLDQQGVDTSDVRDIERGIRRLDTRTLTSDPLALQALKESIEELRHFEFGLWRSIDGKDAEVRSPRAEKAPEGYEAAAEDYFRSLASGGTGGSN